MNEDDRRFFEGLQVQNQNFQQRQQARNNPTQVNITITPGVAKAIGVVIIGFVLLWIVGDVIGRLDAGMPHNVRLAVFAACVIAYCLAAWRIARRRRRRRYY
jgi:formate hydrogenlyase subunit 3/multisubunit Na+/H+ antiporter MnhD subunit